MGRFIPNKAENEKRNLATPAALKGTGTRNRNVSLLLKLQRSS